MLLPLSPNPNFCEAPMVIVFMLLCPFPTLSACLETSTSPQHCPRQDQQEQQSIHSAWNRKVPKGQIESQSSRLKLVQLHLSAQKRQRRFLGMLGDGSILPINTWVLVKIMARPPFGSPKYRNKEAKRDHNFDNHPHGSSLPSQQVP